MATLCPQPLSFGAAWLRDRHCLRQQFKPATALASQMIFSECVEQIPQQTTIHLGWFLLVGIFNKICLTKDFYFIFCLKAGRDQAFTHPA